MGVKIAILSLVTQIAAQASEPRFLFTSISRFERLCFWNVHEDLQDGDPVWYDLYDENDDLFAALQNCHVVKDRVENNRNKSISKLYFKNDVLFKNLLFLLKN